MPQDDRTHDDYVKSFAHILVNANIHVETRRSCFYKGIEDYSKFLLKNRERQYWSSEYRGGPESKKGFEHVIPIKEFIEYFAGRGAVPPDKEVLRNDLDVALCKLLTVCWVSPEENRRLRKEKLSDCLPNGVRFLDLLAVAKNGNVTDEMIFKRYSASNVHINYAKNPPSNFFRIRSKSSNRLLKVPDNWLKTAAGRTWLGTPAGRVWRATLVGTVWCERNGA